MPKLLKLFKSWRAAGCLPKVPSTLFIVLLFSAPTTFAATPTAASRVLARGLNITHWFRYPPSRNPRDLARYLSDSDIEQIEASGFTYLRVPVMMDVVQRKDGTVDGAAIAALHYVLSRLERRGLGVMLVPFTDGLNIRTNQQDRERICRFWRQFGPTLRDLDRSLTYPELLNEPAFSDDADWAAFAQELLVIVRRSLPENTIVLEGNRWSSVDGLLNFKPLADTNVVYSFHYYDPSALTSHLAWNHDIDRTAFRRLPFPADDAIGCRATVGVVVDKRASDHVLKYCAEGWDAPKIRQGISQVAAWSKRHKTTVIMSEFGILVDHERASRLRYIAAVRCAASDNGLGWGLWGYDDGFGLAVPMSGRQGPAHLDPGMLAALGLPGAQKSGVSQCR